MTLKPIDYISINDIFWVQFKPYLVSFGFNGLPKDIHFTISFNDNNPDINFHVTKNADNPNDKPQIRIVCIDKLLLEVYVSSFSLALLNKVLQPINIEELKTKYDNDIGFISFDNLELSDTNSLLKHKLIDSFKNNMEIKRKTRLKIKGDIEKKIESFTTSEELYTSIINNMVELSNEFQKSVEAGMIITEDTILTVIRINEGWFTIKKGMKPSDLITTFVNPKLAHHLIWKTIRAINAVKNAKKYSDTEHLNKPIRLKKIY
jgi:hypothetical protein